MADKELELTPKVYMFAAVGAVIFGVMGLFALSSGPVGIFAGGMVGALAGGALGMFF
jgi:hypothetical protein